MAAYQSVALASQLNGNDAGYLGAAQMAGQQAESVTPPGDLGPEILKTRLVTWDPRS